jgi:hypothetical protein
MVVHVMYIKLDSHCCGICYNIKLSFLLRNKIQPLLGSMPAHFLIAPRSVRLQLPACFFIAAAYSILLAPLPCLSAALD